MDRIVTELFIENNIEDICDLNPISISNRLDVETHFYDEESEALVYQGKKYIFLNKNLDVQDMWFQFCHELGHLQLHKGNQMRFAGTPADSFICYQEMKANRFALLACAPTHILDKYELYKMDHDHAQRFLLENCCMDIYRAKKRLKEYERLHNNLKGNRVL